MGISRVASSRLLCIDEGGGGGRGESHDYTCRHCGGRARNVRASEEDLSFECGCGLLGEIVVHCVVPVMTKLLVPRALRKARSIKDFGSKAHCHDFPEMGGSRRCASIPRMHRTRCSIGTSVGSCQDQESWSAPTEAGEWMNRERRRPFARKARRQRRDV